jgi:hypothetical protein
MRWRLILLVGGLAPLAGCHLAETAFHNSFNEPALYLDEKHVTHQLRAEGRQTVRELRRQQPLSDDFEDGFVDGYADALERGGEPLPPAVPPTKYRRGRFLNPAGHARVHDYFAGFQQGATCAIATGKRQYLTVPVLLADPQPEQTPTVQQVPKEQCAPADAGPKLAPPVPPATTVAPPAPKEKEKEAAASPIVPRPIPADTELVPPKRPLLAGSLVPNPPPTPDTPLPGLPATAPATEPPPPLVREGVVPPVVIPRVVVPPMPEPRR